MFERLTLCVMLYNVKGRYLGQVKAECIQHYAPDNRPPNIEALIVLCRQYGAAFVDIVYLPPKIGADYYECVRYEIHGDYRHLWAIDYWAQPRKRDDSASAYDDVDDYEYYEC